MFASVEVNPLIYALIYVWSKKEVQGVSNSKWQLDQRLFISLTRGKLVAVPVCGALKHSCIPDSQSVLSLNPNAPHYYQQVVPHGGISSFDFQETKLSTCIAQSRSLFGPNSFKAESGDHVSCAFSHKGERVKDVRASSIMCQRNQSSSSSPSWS